MSGPLRLSAAATLKEKVGVYGPPGVGKTVFACSSRAMNTFVFDVDDGLTSARAYRAKRGLSLDAVVFWRIDSIAEFDKAWKYFVANISSFGVVVVDSFTFLQRLMQTEIMVQRKVQKLSQPEWGVVRNVSEEIFQRLMHIPAHVVVCMHEILKFDPDFGRDVWRPSLDGRFGFEYARFLSLIARHQMAYAPGAPGPNGEPTQRVVRALNFGPDPYCHTKDRSDSLLHFEEPDLDAILYKAGASPAATAA